MDAIGAFAHQALIYASNQEFLAAAVPFIESGLRDDEAVFVMTDPGKLALLTDALGDAAERVTFEENTNWYDFPARAIHRVYRGQQEAKSGRIRVIGEPVWSGRSEVQAREWQRYESLVNVAYARFPMHALCPYNARTVPASILADAYRTHPEILNGSKSGPNPDFVDPRAFIRELDAREELPQPEAPASQLFFDGDLGSVRRFVVEEASRAGVAHSRLKEVEWIANEVATNVLEHAGGTATVRAWSGPEEFVFEISDRGHGLEDPLAGHLPPSPDQRSPSALWLAHQLCDLLELRSSTSGLTARLHITFDSIA